jgi:hypothetical protein
MSTLAKMHFDALTTRPNALQTLFRRSSDALQALYALKTLLRRSYDNVMTNFDDAETMFRRAQDDARTICDDHLSVRGESGTERNATEDAISGRYKPT